MTDPGNPDPDRGPDFDADPDLDGADETGLDDWGPDAGAGDAGSPLARALPAVAREVEEFVASGGWEQPTQLFALVRTSALLQSQPELAGEVDASAPLTPVAQDELPEGELDEALAGIEWPEAVVGCAIVQEIVVLPPAAAEELGDLPADSEQARDAAAAHPERQEGRLVAAVLREGVGACVLRVRISDDAPDEEQEQVLEHPDLAPNLLRALLGTLS